MHVSGICFIKNYIFVDLMPIKMSPRVLLVRLRICIMLVTIARILV